MILIITEKPSVARNLAESLEPGNYTSGNGFLKGEKYTYSWAIGHLVTLANAKTYCDNAWDLKNIPIIPNPFKLVPHSKTKKQFNILQSLIKKSSQIINAADAGREGELIFRYILELCPTQAEIKRLWISSYTDQAINNGFENLKPNSDYENLYHSGKARSESDWLFGINATIALTKKINNDTVFSLGRVQTPTFALICKRFIDNKNFKPVPYYVPSITLEHNSIAFKASLFSEEQILNKDIALTLINSLNDTITCIKAEKKEKKINTPLCFDLTSLQIKANNVYGYSADKTLKLTQELYEKEKVVSYPRTDSRYLAEDQKSEINNLLNELKARDSKLIEYLENDISKAKSFNSSKITDHHAIIPLSFQVKDSDWNADKKNIYSLILLQFFMAFGKTAMTEHISYLFKHQDSIFKTSETIYTFLGWKYFDNSEVLNSKLPIINSDQQVAIIKKEIENKQTKPKALYTDASLLKAMNSAGKDFDTEELPPEIKRKGIGTPATRASVIETIIKRDYVTRNKKTIIPTEKGIKLYELIKDFTIANVQLTGAWEEALHFIENGDTQYEEFLNEVKKDLNSKILPDINNIQKTNFKSKLNIDANCPKCNSKIKTNSKAYYCSNREDCNFVLWKTVCYKKLSEKEVINLLKLQITEVKKMKSQDNKIFDSNLYIDKNDDFKLKFYKIEEPSGLNCPGCKKELTNKGNYLACDGPQCDFTLSKTIAKKKLTQTQIEDLINKKRTALISGFKSRANKPFNAMLVLKNNKVKFEF